MDLPMTNTSDSTVIGDNIDTTSIVEGETSQHNKPERSAKKEKTKRIRAETDEIPTWLRLNSDGTKSVLEDPEIKQDVENSNCTEECTENSIDATKETTDEPKSAVKDRLLERENNKKKALQKGASAVSFERIDLNHADYAGQRFRILEALSATGLRSVRYAKKSTIQVMYRTVGTDERYDVVDLDPYGSAAPFLDGAVQSVADGGLLCITCTDMAVLAGSQPESCWAKYGGINIPGTQYTHEMALRILLHSIQSTAAKYRRSIEPLLSCSIDFYVRVFVRVRDSALTKEAASKTSLVFHCAGCRSFTLQPLGKVTRKDKSVRYAPSTGLVISCTLYKLIRGTIDGGAFYSHPIHDSEFLARMLDHVARASPSQYGTHTRMAGMLTVQSEELPIPFYYTLQTLASAVHCQCPALVNFMSAIIHAGFEVSQSHAARAAIKTTAPANIIWDIMRCWCKQHPPSEKNMSPNSPARKLLATEPKIVANFEKHPKATPDSYKYNLVRHQENPTANWGPKARPKTAKFEKEPVKEVTMSDPM
ncbi:N2,N2-dimethylguanosine tRNA methyltransferase [Batrachochytrium salamandrivorans]|nr:N2,N2-dimethylguanosine tRNA methyltransferase [Batrachochytrium salamandrivorans]